MKKFGCITALVGLFIFIISFVLFGTAIFRAADSNQVTAIPLIVGEGTTTDLIDVDTDKLAAIGFDVTFHVSSGIPAEDDFGEPGFAARFRFPYTYTVYDGAGNEIFSADGEMHSGNEIFSADGEMHAGLDEPFAGSRPMHGISEEGGTISTAHFYPTSKFEVGPPGEIRIEALVSRDTEYGATIESVELVVWDNVPAETGTVLLSGIGFLLLGPPIIFVGMVLFVIGLVKGSSKSG